MITYLSITKAREQLPAISDRLTAEPGTVAVTRRGALALAILPWELYESIEETLEIMSDPEGLAALRQSIQQADGGETVAWDELKAEFLP